MNGNGNKNASVSTSPAVGEHTPYARLVQSIHNTAMIALDQLRADGHPELGAPFARILVDLASVDDSALAEIER